MGAWGRNVFQNDTALDIVDEVLDGTFDLTSSARTSVATRTRAT